MPEGKYFSFGVYVDGHKLPEYVIKKKPYTEVDLHQGKGYILEENEQKYPVVPFTIQLQRHCEDVMWMKVHLDGQTIVSKPFKSRHLEVDGIKVGSEIREMLFSLPKLQEDQEKTGHLGKHAGKIRIEMFDAGWVLEKNVPVFSTRACAGDTSADAKLKHLTKRDVASHQEDSLGGIVSREGRATKSVVPTGKFRTLKKYFPSKKLIEELVLRYRPVVSSTVPPKTEAPAVAKREPEISGDHLAQKIHNMSIDEKGDLPPANGNTSGHPGVKKNSATRRQSLVVKFKQAVAPESIKTRESCASALVPPESIKTRESCASALIPPESVKTRESCASALVPPESVKTRESCASALIPPESVKTCGAMISPEKIKKQYSCASETIPQVNKAEEKAEKAQWLTDGFAVIDASDSDEDSEGSELCMNDLHSSYLYMGDEGDSIIYMGDDDCCIFEPDPEEYSIIDVE